MARSLAKAAKGTQFQVGNGGSPEVFTTVTEVKKITGPGIESDTIETTHMDSPGNWKEFVNGLIDGKEVSLECNHIPTDTTQATLRDAVGGDPKNFKLMWPAFANKYVIFPAVVKSFMPDNEVAGVSMVSITLKVAGQPTWS